MQVVLGNYQNLYPAHTYALYPNAVSAMKGVQTWFLKPRAGRVWNCQK